MSINIYNLAMGETPLTCPKPKIRYKILERFPGAASLNFERVLYVFQRYVLGWDPDAKMPLRQVFLNFVGFVFFLTRAVCRQVVPDSNEPGGLFGQVEAYTGVVQDQSRASLHLHSLAWLAGWRKLVDELLKKGKDSEKHAFEELSRRMTETLDNFIRTELDLPDRESTLTRTCLDQKCGGTLIGPNDEKVEALRATNKYHGKDPKVLVCTKCKAKYGCQEVLLSAISSAFERLNLSKIPAGSPQLRKFIQDIKFKLQTQPETFELGTDLHQAVMALVQLSSNSHDPNHNPSCNKKKTDVCRFRLPHFPCAESKVEFNESDEDYYLIVSQKVHPSNMYTASFTSFMSSLFLCNTNTQYVKSQLLGYYIAAYMSKHCRENDEAHAQLESSFRKFYDRLEQERNEREQKRQAAERMEDEKVEEPSAQSLGLRKLLSGVSNLSKTDAVAAQAAGHFLLNNGSFFYSHDFSTLPYKQGIGFINGEDVGCTLAKDNSVNATVWDYAYRNVSLQDKCWYECMGFYKSVQRQRKSSQDLGDEPGMIDVFVMFGLDTETLLFLLCRRIWGARRG